VAAASLWPFGTAAVPPFFLAARFVDVRVEAPVPSADSEPGALPAVGRPKRPFGSLTGALPMDLLDALVPAAAKRPFDIRTAALPAAVTLRLAELAAAIAADLGFADAPLVTPGASVAGPGVLPVPSGSGFTVTVTPDAACFAAAMTVATGAGEPEEAVPEEAVPEEAVPEEAVPEEAVPEEAVPEEAVPEALTEAALAAGTPAIAGLTPDDLEAAPAVTGSSAG
jgi:hypothetical protein